MSNIITYLTVVNTDLTIKKLTELNFFILPLSEHDDLLTLLNADMIDFDNLLRFEL